MSPEDKVSAIIDSNLSSFQSPDEMAKLLKDPNFQDALKNNLGIPEGQNIDIDAKVNPDGRGGAHLEISVTKKGSAEQIAGLRSRIIPNGRGSHSVDPRTTRLETAKNVELRGKLESAVGDALRDGQKEAET